MKAAFGGDAARNERSPSSGGLRSNQNVLQKRSFVFDLLEGEARSDVGDAARFRQPFDDEMLKFDGVANNHAQKIKDEFYYVTAMNENYAQPSMPEGVEEDIIEGLYRVEARAPQESSARVRLLGSGAIFPQVLEAARRLDADWGVASEVWSATSFSELARDAREVERRNRLNPVSPQETSHVSRCLPGTSPIIAATDYVRAYP